MKSLFTGFSAERDPAGNLVVELRAAIGIQLIALAIALAIAPFVTAAAYALAGAPLGFSWPIIGAFFLLIVLIALGIALMFWQRSRSRARVSIDRARSLVLIDSHSGRRELPIRDIENAELGSTISTGKSAATIYRLEFVLRNRERVPATTEYCSASPADREKLLEALNHELSVRSAMLL